MREARRPDEDLLGRIGSVVRRDALLIAAPSRPTVTLLLYYTRARARAREGRHETQSTDKIGSTPAVSPFFPGTRRVVQPDAAGMRACVCARAWWLSIRLARALIVQIKRVSLDTIGTADVHPTSANAVRSIFVASSYPSVRPSVIVVVIFQNIGPQLDTREACSLVSRLIITLN